MREYLNLFATKKVHAPNIVHTIGSKTDHSQEISQTEMAGLLVWIQLSEVIAKYVFFSNFSQIFSVIFS